MVWCGWGWFEWPILRICDRYSNLRWYLSGRGSLRLIFKKESKSLISILGYFRGFGERKWDFGFLIAADFLMMLVVLFLRLRQFQDFVGTPFQKKISSSLFGDSHDFLRSIATPLLLFRSWVPFEARDNKRLRFPPRDLFTFYIFRLFTHFDQNVITLQKPLLNFQPHTHSTLPLYSLTNSVIK